MQKIRYKELEVGSRYGRLTVICLDSIRNGRSYFKCQCDCGNIVAKRSDGLKDTSSCGCWKREKQRDRMLTHGETKTQLYGEWRGIKNRCFVPTSVSYPHYGGRGITMCDEWKNDYTKFRDYVTQLPHYGEDGRSLDRIDNNGNYEPNNVRWATAEEQANNTSQNRILTLNGESHTMREWSKKLGIKPTTLQNRVYYGWSDFEVLTIPVKKGFKRSVSR